jgi:hypothetical protein
MQKDDKIIIYKYEQRRRTLEEVADLLNLSLDIKRLRGRNKLWQVKLERLRLYDENPLKKNYVICRHSNPNYAMMQLCKKISYKTVIALQVTGEDKIVTLGLVERDCLYLRLCEGM